MTNKFVDDLLEAQHHGFDTVEQLKAVADAVDAVMAKLYIDVNGKTGVRTNAYLFVLALVLGEAMANLERMVPQHMDQFFINVIETMQSVRFTVRATAQRLKDEKAADKVPAKEELN